MATKKNNKKAVDKPKKKPVKKVKKAAKKIAKKGIRASLRGLVIGTERDVKERIITSSPLTDVGVEDLTDDLLLKENLSYGTDNLHALELSLDGYVNERERSQHVSSADISNNKTVGTIVKMVKKKLNET